MRLSPMKCINSGLFLIILCFSLSPHFMTSCFFWSHSSAGNAIQRHTQLRWFVDSTLSVWAGCDWYGLCEWFPGLVPSAFWDHLQIPASLMRIKWASDKWLNQWHQLICRSESNTKITEICRSQCAEYKAPLIIRKTLFSNSCSLGISTHNGT